MAKEPTGTLQGLRLPCARKGNRKSTASSGVDVSIAPRSSVRKCAADEKEREDFSLSCTLRVASKGALKGREEHRTAALRRLFLI